MSVLVLLCDNSNDCAVMIISLSLVQTGGTEKALKTLPRSSVVQRSCVSSQSYRSYEVKYILTRRVFEAISPTVNRLIHRNRKRITRTSAISFSFSIPRVEVAGLCSYECISFYVKRTKQERGRDETWFFQVIPPISERILSKYLFVSFFYFIFFFSRKNE